MNSLWHSKKHELFQLLLVGMSAVLMSCSKVVPQITSLLKSSNSESQLVWVSESTSGTRISSNQTFGFTKQQFEVGANWSQVSKVKYTLNSTSVSPVCSATPSGTLIEISANTTITTTGLPQGTYLLCLWATSASSNNLGWNDYLIEKRWTRAYQTKLLSVTSSAADQAYGVGSVISLQAQFSNPVIVTGTVTMSLDVGSGIPLQSTSGDKLFFNYSVLNGQNSGDLDFISLVYSAASLKDVYGEAVDGSLAAVAYGLAAQKDIRIDTTAPATPSLGYYMPAASPSADASPEFSATGLVAGDYIHLFKDNCSGTPFSTWTASGSSQTLPLPTLTDGSYQFFIQAVDSVGNRSACSSALAYQLDSRTPIAVLQSGSIPVLGVNDFTDTVRNSGAGPSLSAYRYSVISSGGDCGTATYTNELVGTMVMPPPPTNGNYRLCLVGKNTLDLWQAFASATIYEFTVNRTPPAISMSKTEDWIGPNYSNTLTLTISGASTYNLISSMIHFSGAGAPCSFGLVTVGLGQYQVHVNSCSGMGAVDISIDAGAATSASGISSNAMEFLAYLKSDDEAPSGINLSWNGLKSANGSFYSPVMTGPSVTISPPVVAVTEHPEHKYAGPFSSLAACNSSNTWQSLNSVVSNVPVNLALTNAVNTVYFKITDGVNNVSSCFGQNITHDDIAPILSSLNWTSYSGYHVNPLTSPAFSAIYTDSNPATGFMAYVGSTAGAFDLGYYPFQLGSAVSSSGLNGLSSSFLNGENYYLSVKGRDAAENYSSPLTLGWRQFCGNALLCRQSYLKANDFAANAKAGLSMAMDGNLLAVGAPFYNAGSGAVFFFKKTVTGWVYKARMNNPGSVAKSFGKKVVFKGQKLLVSAPLAISAGNQASVYGYTFDGTNFTPSFRVYSNSLTSSEDQFGAAMDFSPVTGTVVVGDPTYSSGLSRIGALYKFNFNSTTGDTQLSPSMTGDVANRSLASEIALSRDGVVLALISGNLSFVIPTQVKIFKSDDGFTNSVQQINESSSSPGKVSISEDGRLILFTIPDASVAKLIRFDIVTPANSLVSNFTLPGGVSGVDKFGFTAAIRRDGTNDHIFVGAPGTNSESGAIYGYSATSGGTFSLTQTILSPFGNAERFGHSLALGTPSSSSERILVVGAPQQATAAGDVQNGDNSSIGYDSGSNNSGAAYVFSLPPPIL